VIEYPPYRPSDVSLRLPNQPVIPNFWRSTEAPEITGSIPEGAELRLTYRNIPDSEALELLLSWRATAGGSFPFPTLPAQVAAGVENAAMARRITTPTPLVWALAEPPRQSSSKAGRSTVEVFLRTELRFSLVLTGPPPPEAPSVPDMWASRCTSQLGQRWNLRQSVVMCEDGTSYQVALVEMLDNPLFCDLCVIRRNNQGEVLWNKRLQNVTYYNFTNSPLPYFFALAVGTENELYISSRDIFKWRQFAGDTTYDSAFMPVGIKKDSLAVCVNQNGTLRWQKRYGFDETYRPSGVIHNASRKPETETHFILHSSAGASVYFVGVTSTSSGGGVPTRQTVFIIRASAATGVVQNAKTFWVSDPETTGRPAEFVTVRVRNSRLYLTGSCGWRDSNVYRGFVIELSLDLGTVFSSLQVNGILLNSVAPAADGGWHVQGSIGGDTNHAYKLTSTFQPVSRQQSINSGWSFWSRINGENYDQQSVGTPTLKEGNPVYTATFADFRGNSAARAMDHVKNLSLTGRITGASISGEFDHGVSLGCTWATEAALPGAEFGQHQHSTLNQTYSLLTNSSISGYHYNFAPQNARLVAYGYKGQRDDEGERWMDAGLELSSGFVMVSRSQLDGDYGKVVNNTSDAVFPAVFSYEWPETITANVLTEADADFNWSDGVLTFGYYSYRDPEFTAPAAEGSTGLALYTGNSAVQKVSVSAQFTPAFILLRNRSSGNSLVWSSNLLRSQFRWFNSNLALQTVSSDNFLQGVGEGFFRISGRDTSPNWNVLNNNYVAIALEAIAGGMQVIDYVGNGATSRAIAHSLGQAPQLCLVNRSTLAPAGGSLIGANFYVNVTSDAARVAATDRFQAFTGTDLTIGSVINANTVAYSMYLFASCNAWDLGTYSGDGAAAQIVSLGYQPKAAIIKPIIGGTGHWMLYYRPDGTPGLCQFAPISTSTAEATSTTVSITATGFTVAAGGVGNSGGVTALYWALR
jgi:hypothetical protein